MPSDKLTPKILQLYLEISQYPILSRRIRQRMRDEIFERGVVSVQRFEDEVRTKAIESQQREGLTDPLFQEPASVWQTRVEKVRDDLTDFYFAYNLPHDLFQEIIKEVIEQRSPGHPVVLTFNPELAPWDVLFAQAEAYERLPPDQQAGIQHHLQEIIVVLIRTLISDQLRFVGVARQFLSVADLRFIMNQRIGRGKIGGKAAGMFLAYKILQRLGPEHGLDPDGIRIPDSYFLGADVYYDFKSANASDMFPMMNQKYRPQQDIIGDYPAIYQAHLNSRLPDYVQDGLVRLLEQVGKAPLIVRSSSLLEDSFDRSFAGKYDSFFLPNQGTLKENLRELTTAIIKVYASVVRPDVLIYRQTMGLIDYDERMAVLIQKVEGQSYGRYFYPAFAGVGFSHNPYRWNKRIRAEEGLLRLVAGLGTRAVDRVGLDYPRMVAISHPELRPERGAAMLRRYSQRYMDVLDLQDNEFKTLHFTEVIDKNYPAVRSTISLDHEGTILPLSARPLALDPQQMVVTFDGLLSRSDFVGLMRDALAILAQAYARPVDVEFAGEVVSEHPATRVRLSLLQCRPLSHNHPAQSQVIPELPPEDILFSSHHQVPDGAVDGIRTIVYVDPAAYAAITDPEMMVGVGRVISRLNNCLPPKSFILMGPGRWGTSNISLGVKVSYADIYKTAVLAEIAFREGGGDPELSYGTHFFQDLVEAHIFPLPIYPDDPQATFRADFFKTATNGLAEILPADAQFSEVVKVIDLPSVTGATLTIVMDSEHDHAVAFLSHAASASEA